MTSPHRQPAGIPVGGQFAPGGQARSDVALDADALRPIEGYLAYVGGDPVEHHLGDVPEADMAITHHGTTNLRPYGEGQPWNEDPARREDLERVLATQMASTPWGRSDNLQLARRVFEGAPMYRGVPTEDFHDSPAGSEAAQRGDDALHTAEQAAAEPLSDVRRADLVYDAVLPVIEAVQARTFTPNGFRSARPQPSPAPVEEPYDELAEFPPTRREVDEAKALLDLHSPVRPMYRGDWQRINGGSGPTVAQHRAHMSDLHESRSARDRARADYERLLAAWEASDKSQDIEDRSVRCDNCGIWYDRFEGRCHMCGES